MGISLGLMTLNNKVLKHQDLKGSLFKRRDRLAEESFA